MSGITDRNGTWLNQYSNQRPPDSASHGVPTASAARPKPVWGARKTSHASTSASCSASGRSKPSSGARAVGAQGGQLAGADRGRGALVARQPADQDDPRVRQRVEDPLPRRERRVQRPLARPGRQHGDRTAVAGPLARRGPQRLRELQTERPVRQVRRREAGGARRRVEVRVARRVVGAQPGNSSSWWRLVAARVVEHAVPRAAGCGADRAATGRTANARPRRPRPPTGSTPPARPASPRSARPTRRARRGDARARSAALRPRARRAGRRRS